MREATYIPSVNDEPSSIIENIYYPYLTKILKLMLLGTTVNNKKTPLNIETPISINVLPRASFCNSDFFLANNP